MAIGKTLLFYYFTILLWVLNEVTKIIIIYSYVHSFCTSLHAINFFEKVLFAEINACKSPTNLLALLFYGVNKFTLLLDWVKQGPKVHNVHTESSVDI